MSNSVLNDKELAKILDPTGKIVTTWTIRKWRIEGKMPFFSIGKRIFFRLESVLGWIQALENGEKKSETELGKIRKID